MTCKQCNSAAINPHLHGRQAGVDLDLCDVCYWRARAAQARAQASDELKRSEAFEFEGNRRQPQATSRVDELKITREELVALLKETAEGAARVAMEGAREGYESALPAQFARVAAAARAQAFEEAAKACDELARLYPDEGGAPDDCAAAIRALATKDAK